MVDSSWEKTVFLTGTMHAIAVRSARVVLVGALLWGFSGRARASDLADALSFARSVMGDKILAGYEDFVDDDPDEALGLLLSRVVKPGMPLSAYSGDRHAAEAHPYFDTLGPTRLSFERLRPFIEDAARQSRMPVALLDAVIRTESGYRPGAVSRAGAQGLMQLMPATAAALGVDDPLDPRANIIAGARYLREQYERFGSLPLALAAYNAGPGKVAAAGDRIPNIPETQRYVATVLRRFRASPLR